MIYFSKIFVLLEVLMIILINAKVYSFSCLSKLVDSFIVVLVVA